LSRKPAVLAAAPPCGDMTLMKRSLLAVMAGCALIGAVALSSSQKPSSLGNGDLQIQIEERNPWTHLRLNNDPAEFRFALVSDRTGGHRARVFSQAVEQLNLLQPAFVVSVGDLVEGYTKDKKVLNEQWKELNGYVNKLQMPFFYIAGNHDVANGAQVEDWKERFGKRFYHFIYRDVLFLAACSDDQGENKGYGAVSKEQVEYFQNVLKQNQNVRWTVLIIHKPVWDLAKANVEGFLEIEKA